MNTLTLEADFAEHPKVGELSDAAFRAHVKFLCWCSRFETDGKLPTNAATKLVSDSVLDELVRGRLWIRDPADGSLSIKDYLHYNPSREEIERKRQFSTRRSNIRSNATLCAALKRRDGDRCRYCGTQVDWRNRRGADGGTYDHVRPISRGGTDEEHNLVVCCRSCNTSKGDRTPGEARMVLLPENCQEPAGNQPVSGRKPAKTHTSEDQIKISVTDQSPDQSEQLVSLGSGRARKWRRVPTEWAPSQQHEDLAHSLSVDFAVELASFRDHEFRDPKTDADAAFRTWIRNAKRFSRCGAATRATQPKQPNAGHWKPPVEREGDP